MISLRFNSFLLIFLLFFSGYASSEVIFYSEPSEGDRFYDYIISKDFSFEGVSLDSSPEEIYAVGVCYLHGCPEIGRSGKDYKKAVKYIKRSLALGVYDAYYDLGYMYFNGCFFGKDIDKAIEFFKEGARNGDVRAQQTLGRIYYGHFDEAYENYAESFEWYVLAARAGAKHAMSRISYYYYKGIGVQRDEEKALFWAKQIELNTHRMIEYFPKILSAYYEKGVGTPVDLVQAVKYYILEGSAGSDDVARLREKMTEEEFQEAVRLANEWQVEHRIRVPRYYH